jgi:hypothetical protein
MLVRWQVPAAREARALEIAQSWRRDQRAGLDMVATWTSLDGTWPIQPHDGIPFSSASR